MRRTEVGRRIEGVLKATFRRRGLLRDFEEFVCGQNFARIIADHHSEKLTSILADPGISEESEVLARQEKMADRWHEIADYGRPLTNESRDCVHELYGEHFNKAELRDAIFGRIIWSDGRLDVAIWRKRFLSVFGWLWHVVATTTVALLILLAILLPGLMVTKVIVVSVLLAFYLACVGFMNSISLRAVWSWERFRSYVLRSRTSNVFDSQ